MKILQGYISKTLLVSMGLTTLMLVGLQIFILFVDQLGDLGKADYGIKQAATFVLLQMPYQVYLFFPMASLLGCLLGLGTLANHSELVILRASGMSILQITNIVLKTSLVLVCTVTLLGETVIPYLSHYANDYKASALSSGQTLRTSKGFWFRSKNNFISVEQVLSDHEIQNVYQFQFDGEHRLQNTRFIKKLDYTPKEGWVAYEIHQTEFASKGTHVRVIPKMPWNVPLKPKILRISTVDPDEMNLAELKRYIREQKHNHQSVTNYQFSFLQRLIQPLTTLVMMLLAIPFIFGPLRSSTMGSKLIVGAAVGFGFHILSHFFGPLSSVFQLRPEVAVLGPLLVFTCVGLYLIRRVR